MDARTPELRSGHNVLLTVAEKLGIERLARPLRTALERRERRRPGTRALLGRDDRHLVWTGGQVLVSQKVPGVSPGRLAVAAYERVRAVLDDAAIGHVVVSRSELRSFQVAVDEADWDRALDALAHRYGDSTVYLDLAARTVRGNTVRRALHPADPEAIDAARDSSIVRVFALTTDSVSERTYGRNVACELQRWNRSDGVVRPSGPNETAQFVSADMFDDRVEVTNRVGATEARLAAAAAQDPALVDFPIDVVYMWVDGEDPRWQARFDRARGVVREDVPAPDGEATAPWRFRDRDELLYSMRSLEMYAPWIRNVYLVTDDQAPVWLDLDHPHLHVVSHRGIFRDTSALPVFNSHAIGSQLHHVEGLSEHFLVLNDDVMFGAPTPPEHFFTGSGIVRFRPSRTRSPLAAREHLSEIENARLNAADLLEADFGRRCSALFTHMPLPQVVSVAHELEQRYPDAYDRTMRSRFRNRSDVETNAWLQLNYLLLTGRAVESRVRYDYFNVGEPAARERLASSLAREHAQVLCINDGPSEDGVDYDEWLVTTLATYFPRPSSFELPRERWRSSTSLEEQSP